MINKNKQNKEKTEQKKQTTLTLHISECLQMSVVFQMSVSVGR